MSRATLCLVLVTGACAGDTEVPPPQDPQGSLAHWDARLAPILDPLDARIGRAASAIRADSGTVAADSAFLRFKEHFERLVQVTAEELDDEEFQVAVYPRGAAGVRLRRAQGEDPFEVDEATRARADSLTAHLSRGPIWVYRAEGDAYVAPNEGMLLERMGPYLTEPVRAVQRLAVAEQERPSAGDGSLMIPVDSLTGRLTATDRLVHGLGDHAALAQAERYHRFYLRALLLGLPNSDAFDWRTGVLTDERRSTLERYASAHLDTPTGELVRRYLSVLRGNDYQLTPRVRSFLEAQAGLGNR